MTVVWNTHICENWKIKYGLTLQVYISGSCGYLIIPNALHFPLNCNASIHLLMNFDVTIGQTNCYQTGKFQENSLIINKQTIKVTEKGNKLRTHIADTWQKKVIEKEIDVDFDFFFFHLFTSFFLPNRNTCKIKNIRKKVGCLPSSSLLKSLVWRLFC